MEHFVRASKLIFIAAALVFALYGGDLFGTTARADGGCPSGFVCEGSSQSGCDCPIGNVECKGCFIPSGQNGCGTCSSGGGEELLQ